MSVGYGTLELRKPVRVGPWILLAAFMMILGLIAGLTIPRNTSTTHRGAALSVSDLARVNANSVAAVREQGTKSPVYLVGRNLLGTAPLPAPDYLTNSYAGVRESGAFVSGIGDAALANSVAAYREQGSTMPVTPDWFKNSFAGMREQGAGDPDTCGVTCHPLP